MVFLLCFSFRGRRSDRRGDKTAWVPVTKLGRLVHANMFSSIEEIFLYSLPIKEYEIIDHFFPADTLQDCLMKIMTVQKQTTAGQRTRSKAFVIVGDGNGHIGLGVKVASEATTAIHGAIQNAKTQLCPVRRGYWGNRVGKPHTVPCKLTGKCGSVRCRLVPAPRGTGLVASPHSKKMLSMVGISDCYTSSRGHTRTIGNFIKATFFALKASYGYLSPDLWAVTSLGRTPLQEHSEFLKNTVKGVKN